MEDIGEAGEGKGAPWSRKEENYIKEQEQSVSQVLVWGEEHGGGASGEGVGTASQQQGVGLEHEEGEAGEHSSILQQNTATR